MKKSIVRSKSIFVNRFVKLVEEYHGQLSERFLNDSLNNPETDAYRTA